MLKRITSFISVLVFSLSSLFVFAPSLVHAAADTCVWTGGGGDDNISTAANWSTCDNGNVPEAGDTLSFPALGTKETVVNDTALTYAGVTFTGASGTCTSAPYAWYVITSTQALSLSGNISNTMTGSCKSVYMDSDITLAGNISVTASSRIEFGFTIGKTIALGSNTLTLDGELAVNSSITGGASSSIVKNGIDYLVLNDNSTFSGSIVLNGGTTNLGPNSFGNTTGGTTVNAGASLVTYLANNTTLSENITLNGAPYDLDQGKLRLGVSGAQEEVVSAAYAGTLTLGADVTFASSNYYSTLTISGVVNGPHKITRVDGSTGKLVLAASTNNSQTPNGDIIAARKQNTISANQAYGSYIYGNNQTTINEGVVVTGNSETNEDGILVINGNIVGTLEINDDSIVKGNGTVQGAVTLADRAKLAPGLSPGCLATGDLTFVAGTFYEFEVGGATACTEYDKTTVTGTVNLGNGTLNVVRYNEFKPVQGQSYTIIENDAADAVTGTFLDLAEGATFAVDGYVLKISYVGGDGNDVVLTVQSVPAVPDTGFKLITNNPLLTLAATSIMAGAMLVIAKKYARATNR